MALRNLKKEMAGADITVEAVADALKVHRNTVANKIDGSSKFTVDEAFRIRDKFFPKLGLEYLFQNDA
jgi:plasmid maintenance system antidote protein VapI